jgi:predicted ATPase/class 3 adenylate cyclase
VGGYEHPGGTFGARATAPAGDGDGDAGGPLFHARPALPTGTVTFLFTDVEGSTRLARELGEAWLPLLHRHREIIRAALTGHGGVEVQTEGDGFFAAFSRAPAAVSAVAQAQRDLAVEPWPPGAAIRVRMGLHAGEGVVDADGSYVGHAVHRAARIAAAGHGGQVLVSAAVRALADDALPPGVTVRDLGEHRLKDLRPEPLAQLVIEGLPAEFPPIRSLDARPNNLPTQLTSFVGRDRDLAEAAGLLAGTRLLTLTGPGGTGKTRLALQLAASTADEHPDGTWFVALEPIASPDLVLPTIARTIGVAERAGTSALDVLVAAIGDRRMLLLLDNFEQVVEAAGDAGALLRACPALRIVVTSRAVLRIAGEQEYVVPGLPAPPDTSRLSRVELENLPASLRHPDPATLGQYEAVRLFIARAVAVRPGFAVTNENAPAVAGICARLHGMPLAIELAAARVKLLTPEQILVRLEDQLGLLTSTARDLPDRQRTLRGAIAWSCDLLEADERRMFARLSVFRGGWDLAAAEAVAGAGPASAGDVLDGLASLADQSLVRSRETDGEIRFDMFETIREFAAGMLTAAGEAEAVGEAHARAFLDVAEQAAPHLQGAGQRAWLDRLEHDHDNLRAALAFLVQRPEPELAVRLAHALWRFWQQRGYLVEARRTLDRMGGEEWGLAPGDRARLAEAFGGVAYWQADLPVATRWYDEALAVWRAEAADGGADARRELANALYNRAYVAVADLFLSTPGARVDPKVQAMMEEALAIYRSLGDRAGEGNVLWGLGSLLMFADRPERADAYYHDAIAVHRETGNRTMEAWSLQMLASSLVMRDRAGEAREPARHALRHFQEGSDVAGITLALDVLSAVSMAAGERARGGRLWGAARALQRASGTGLADWDEQLFSTKSHGVRTALEPAELERLAADGADLPLADVVAYALGELDPFGSSDTTGARGSAHQVDRDDRGEGEDDAVAEHDHDRPRRRRQAAMEERADRGEKRLPGE